MISDIQDAARDGPIIVFIVSRSSCNAIQKTVKREDGPERVPNKVDRSSAGVMVCPVVENLGKLAQPGSRIWWRSTSWSTFLPLHAAGEYRKGGINLWHLYVSSCTSSLTVLISARGGRDRPQPAPFAAMSQTRNLPAGAKFALEFVEPELELLRPTASTVSYTEVTSVESTKAIALCTLRDNPFPMRDQPLTLLDIVAQMDVSQFAFLSACETAVGNFETPDEVIHPAAGLQFAGEGSVIGIFWGVNNTTVQRLANEFYGGFYVDSKMNSKKFARALHRAIRLPASDEDITLN
ncbi:hypothetical protein AZE42_02491 [Rhizopogon vesiculosus]|uniref:CHAT domain-containing protein n=1 Tax=Rhizopogon vesiculosus TaxID=180088 RepID=A0A1J8QEH3_9AGAM|nr:hypothetical protein AZE42_02491 [Rhizopogon vesiculosus]